MREENHIYDDHIDESLLNEEEDSSIVEELSDELTEQEQTETEQLAAERDEYKEKYLYALAEIDNLKKRHAKDLENTRWQSGANVLRSILSVVDDFELAIANNQSLVEQDFVLDDVTQAAFDGFELIYNKLNAALDNAGCKRMDVRPDNDVYVDFDTDYHEAVAMMPLNNKKLNGKIVDVQQNGYMYKDRVLRHAKVIVGQCADEKE